MQARYNMLFDDSGLKSESDSDVEIVVARYEEDLQWLFPSGKRAIIYNKGKALDAETAAKFKAVVELPNVGREAHTYLYHIVNKWDTLAKVTIFVQGRINDHCPIVYRHRLDSYVRELGRQASLYGVSKNACAHRKGLMSAIPEFKMSTFYPYIQDTGLTYGVWLEAHVLRHLVPKTSTCIPVPSFPQHLKWYIGAVFAAERVAIKKTSKFIYEGLLEDLSGARDPESAYFMERTWYFLMTHEFPRIPIL